MLLQTCVFPEGETHVFEKCECKRLDLCVFVLERYNNDLFDNCISYNDISLSFNIIKLSHISLWIQ